MIMFFPMGSWNYYYEKTREIYLDSGAAKQFYKLLLPINKTWFSMEKFISELGNENFMVCKRITLNEEWESNYKCQVFFIGLWIERYLGK